VADHQEEHDEDEVDDRGGRPEEVIVVLGDELPELVDEEAEADPAEDRRHVPSPPVDPDQREPDGHQHEQTAPEEMGDVNAPPAQLRIVGQPELGPDDQDHYDRCNQELLELRDRIPAVDRI
jgi:hypothetical protein